MARELSLGELFVVDGIKVRRVIFQGGRPIGHWTCRDMSDEGVLWLQNYAGYYHERFELRFNSLEQALARAEKILAEWSETGWDSKRLFDVPTVYFPKEPVANTCWLVTVNLKASCPADLLLSIEEEV